MSQPANFRFCPDCGHASSRAPDPRQFRCNDCGYSIFYNVACAVAALMRHDGSLLIATRARDPGAGTLDLPGGFIDPGESVEQALARELEEELGLSEPPGALRYFASCPNTYAYGGIEYQVCDLFYLIDCPHRPPVVAADDVQQLDWIRETDLEVDRFGMASVRHVLAEYRRLAPA